MARVGDIGDDDPPTTEYGIFDDVGGGGVLQDVVVNYLGAHELPSNPARPPVDTRGFLGLDMTEFLDGLLCRGHLRESLVLGIAKDLMDFQAYDPALAPPSCD